MAHVDNGAAAAAEAEEEEVRSGPALPTASVRSRLFGSIINSI